MKLVSIEKEGYSKNKGGADDENKGRKMKRALPNSYIRLIIG